MSQGAGRMTLKNQTKLLFAKKIEEMLESMSLEQVRIVELCKRVGTIPQTFYYHFRDKYELVAWIFLYDFSVVYGDRSPNYTKNRIIENLKQIEKRRTFYLKAYMDQSQNSINRYIQNFNVQTAITTVKNSRDGEEPTEMEINQIKYHSYGMMGLFAEWLAGTSKLTIEKLAEFQYECTPDFLKQAYKEHPFQRSKLFKEDF